MLVTLTFGVLLLLVAFHPNGAPKGARLRFKHAELASLGVCLFGSASAALDNAFLGVAHNDSTWRLVLVGTLFCLQALSLLLLVAWTVRLLKWRHSGHGGGAVT